MRDSYQHLRNQGIQWMELTEGFFLGGGGVWRGGLNHMARSWMSNDRLMAKRVFQVQVLH